MFLILHVRRNFTFSQEVVSSSDQSIEILATSSFTTVTGEDAKFLVDVYSWKWFWAAGKRYLLVGLGVGTSD